MKKLGLFFVFSLLSGFLMISTASAQVPRACMDHQGHVLCQKRGCEAYCRPAPLPPPPPPMPHHVKPAPLPPPPPPAPHHVHPAPLPPPPPPAPHHVKPAPLPPPPAPHHVKPAPLPPPPAPHHGGPGHYNSHNDRLSLDRQIDELERDNRHYRQQLRETFNPYERNHLEAAIERNEREIERLQRERRYYR